MFSAPGDIKLRTGDSIAQNAIACNAHYLAFSQGGAGNWNFWDHLPLRKTCSVKKTCRKKRYQVHLNFVNSFWSRGIIKVASEVKLNEWLVNARFNKIKWKKNSFMRLTTSQNLQSYHSKNCNIHILQSLQLYKLWDAHRSEGDQQNQICFSLKLSSVTI